ncbi:MAG: FkbM family methyltransferase [Thermoflexibacteraceae bacterium]|jgi:FkbM family methyltransferase
MSIEKIVFSLLGRRRAKNIISVLKNRKPKFYETEIILDYFYQYARQGVMIDVGCHHGEASQPFLELGWQVYAFEPDRQNYGKIPTHHLRKLYPYAVSEESGKEVPFFQSAIDGISSLSAFHTTHTTNYTVKTIALRDFLHQEQITQVDFLKIDIEGYDFFALKGFPFDTIQPEMILCEFEDNKTIPLGYTHKDMADFLVAKGYQVWLAEWFPIEQYGSNHQWRKIDKYPVEVVDAKCWGNFIAIRNDKKQQLATTLQETMKAFG